MANEAAAKPAAGAETPKPGETNASTEAAAAAGATTTNDGKTPAEGEAAAAAAAGEKKPAATEGKTSEELAAAAATPPEKYELTIPEGAETWLGDEDLATIATIAKAQGWTNEQAQQALDEHADRLVAQSAQFRELTEADPELGGDKLEATQQLATRALDRIRPTTHKRSAAFRQLLTKSGYGNHPEVIAFLADIGKMLKEDTPAVSGTTTSTEKKSTAEKFYGKA